MAPAFILLLFASIARLIILYIVLLFFLAPGASARLHDPTRSFAQKTAPKALSGHAAAHLLVVSSE